MSYATIAKNAEDEAFMDRVTAAIAQEGKPNPQQYLSVLLWGVCAKGDIEAAYASALAAQHPNPGGDESVITDGMILAAVQAELAELEPA